MLKGGVDEAAKLDFIQEPKGSKLAQLLRRPLLVLSVCGNKSSIDGFGAERDAVSTDILVALLLLLQVSGDPNVGDVIIEDVAALADHSIEEVGSNLGAVADTANSLERASVHKINAAQLLYRLGVEEDQTIGAPS